MPDPAASVNSRRPDMGRTFYDLINTQRRRGEVSPYAGPTVTVQDRGMMPTGGRGVPNGAEVTVLGATLGTIRIRLNQVGHGASLDHLLTSVEQALISPGGERAASLLRAIARHRALNWPIPDPDRDDR